MAYSQGFNPHPRISWIGAAPTGVASEAEYLEIQVVHMLDPRALAEQLNAALPDGLDVLEATGSAGGSLADRIEASHWRIELPGVSGTDLSAAVDLLMSADSVEVERLTKDGRRIIDARPAVVAARVSTDGESGECGILDVVVRQTTPAVRPDDVLSALRIVAALELSVPAKATRLAQGRLDDEGGLSDPLAQDRAQRDGASPGEQE
jgi:radical SAM-linked protein